MVTEAEALDMAAKAAGWRDWKEAHERTWELDGMRAHAKTIMENAALEAKLADVSKALMATAEAAASSAKKAVEAEAKLAIAREALERLRDCDWTITLPDRMDGVRDIARAALKEIEGD